VQPDVCIITPISYEHTDILGKTLTLIAAEKIRHHQKGQYCRQFPQPEEADAAIAAVCDKQGAKLIRVGKDVTYRSTKFDDSKQSFSGQGKVRQL